MGANTKIEWATHTFNPWIGCTRISAACDHCYAEAYARRIGKASLWQGGRQRTSPANWRLPLKWNREAAASGTRPRVFCASLADVFDNQVPEEWRNDLWALIARTPNLDWLLLTKRPQNVAKMLPVWDRLIGIDMPMWSWPWPNVWLGTTVETQEEADRRIPHLLSVPARVHFLSCEPLLGPIDLRRVHVQYKNDCGRYADALDLPFDFIGSVKWVICGGESGAQWRQMQAEWAESLLRQCGDAGVPFFMKQLSGLRPEKELARFPERLRVRQFPEALAA